MAPARLLALLLLLAGARAAHAESIRETEVIDPQDLREGRFFSGPLPDDEDAGGPGRELDDLELSGSGDLDDSEDPKVFPKVIQPLVPIDNHIPERAGPGSRVPTEPGTRTCPTRCPCPALPRAATSSREKRSWRL
uniref:Syndecan 4 n=1 Tax=Pipistrellus kuhlii TaxID=59472 RepID=A0A7J7YAK5_PIPKU|nr:syndecan 4 [Pipistrellus kuhlii]